MTDQLAKLSSKTLKEKTGRDWAEWVEWLDNVRSDIRSQKDLIALLADHVTSPWYRQKIALGYREAMGQRQTGELSSGYKLPRAADRDAMKRYWQEKLSLLAEIIKGK
ncbi:hypothetical protein SAMN04487996_110144 [Dyadobacter soli]|uniref:Uncharacterized protein n=2 Tax=Dyadobacter soli TaxID=659014 RepID=A0A1G7KK21_9BACT|nr:hypothetical protein SAMN04487996_110144 [Dyadobacter soli]